MIDLTERFWNSRKIVTEFRGAQPQDYWVDYFFSINGKDQKFVLDLGCGGGRYTEMLARMGFKVYAFDFHQGMVDETKKRIAELADLKFKPIIIRAEMSHTQLPENKFDILLANGVFHNAKSLEELEKTLDETSRILIKGGTLCLNIFYDGGNNSLLEETNQKYMFTTKDQLPMVLLPLTDLDNLLRKHGFEKMGEMISYTRDMEVGTRDVVRGLFKKT